MIQFPKPYADFVARLRVPSGFLLVVVFALLSHPSAVSLACGLPIALAGIGLRAWSAGCLAKNQRLSTGGPYAYTRNPLYLGTLLVAAGLVVASRNPGLGALFAAVFLFVYLPVIQLEQQHLRRLFPEYSEYAASVPALLPRLTPGTQNNSHPFEMRLYLLNREYQAGGVFLAGIVFLFVKLAAKA